MPLAFPSFGTALPAAPVPPGTPDIIAASVWRFDGNSGNVRVSSGGALQPGQATAATLAQMRVYTAAQPLLRSLVSCWPLNEASGNALDAYGTNPLTDTNTVGSAAGKLGTARDFERTTGEYFNRAGNPDLNVGNQDFTYTGWVEAESLTGNATVLVKDAQELVLGLNPSATAFQFEVWGGVAGTNHAVVTASSVTPSVGVWYFLAAWYDAGADTLNLQVNNGTVHSVTHTFGVYAGSGSFRLGWWALGDYWDGRIDEVSFWKRVLTAGERTALYNGGAGLAFPFGPGAGLTEQAVALHPLDGTFPDGSYRSVGIQFLHDLVNNTPVAAEIHVRTGTARGTTDIAWVEPTAVTVKNRAVIAPTDPVHLCKTFVTLGPLTPATNDTGLGLAWSNYGVARWADTGVRSGAVPGAASYDFCNGMLQYFCRTGTRQWYEDWYNWAMSNVDDPDSGIVRNASADLHLLIPYGLSTAALASGCTADERDKINPESIDGQNGSCGGAAEAYSLRTFSYASAYWMSAWRQHKRNLVRTLNVATGYVEAGYAAQSYYWMTGFGHRYNFGVQLNAILMGYLLGCTTKIVTQAGLEGPDTWDYATFLPWTIDAIEDAIYQEYPGLDVVGQDRRSYAIPVPGNPDTGISTFMISLIPFNYLALYYDHVYPDARIPGLIEKLALYAISQYRQSLPGDTEYPDSWVASYVNIPPAAIIDPYFVGTISTANNRLYWVSGTMMPDYARTGDQPIYRVSGTGNWASQRTPTSAFSGDGGADPSTSTYWVMSANATVSGTATFMIPMAGWFLGMAHGLFAWLYAHTGNSLYSTWRDRVVKTANIKAYPDGGNLGYQTKIWGEYWGGIGQSWLYYHNGGTIRGAPGVHPTSIVNPPLQPHSDDEESRMTPTDLTPDDLAQILQKLEEHDALLGEHEERLTALESAPAPAEPPEEAPD